MLYKARVKHGKTNSSIAIILITIAVEQIKSQKTRPHGVWTGHVITDVMLLLIITMTS